MQHLWKPVAWLVLVAALPWWLGLPLLIALAGVAMLLQTRLHAAELLLFRRALRWGLPGFLLAVLYALGGDVLAWVMTLVAALAGFTLIAGIEAWLDRELRRDPEDSVDAAEWPEMARRAVAPAVNIIELQPPEWGSLSIGVTDPRGGRVSYREGSIHFADGTVIVAAGPDAGFSPDGQWFFARLQGDPGIVLWDRQHDRQQRLPGWDLSGWYRDRPWIMRGKDGAPQTL